MAEYQQRMADRITAERKRRGLSREDLAARAGVSYRQIQRIESGHAEPRAGTLRSIASVLEVDVEELQPDLEAEEQELRDQLQRIERKLDSIDIAQKQILSLLENGFSEQLSDAGDLPFSPPPLPEPEPTHEEQAGSESAAEELP